jgi:osmoprotectant transport system permease protein
VTLPTAGVSGASPGHAIEVSCYSRLTNEWFCQQYFEDRRQDLVDATVQHVQITLAAVLLGVLIAFPLALVARRYGWLEGPVLAISTGIYTIPSIALLPLLVPFTGLSRTTVVIGLALYALTVLVRALLEGLRAVPDEVRESATGLGFGRARLLFRVELPLALPVAMAGLRVATVSTVALTTIGSLVAYGGLGNLIKDGVTNNFRAELAAAALLCVVLALLLDVLLVAVQWVLTPWAHQGRRTRRGSAAEAAETGSETGVPA